MSGYHKLALSCPLAELHQFTAFPLVWASTTSQAFCKKKKNHQNFFTIDGRWSLVQIKVVVSRFRTLCLALCPIYCCTCEAGSSPWCVFMWVLIPLNLCIKATPNHLECQAAISIRDTWYANTHITAHTWRTFPAAVGDAHSESL